MKELKKCKTCGQMKPLSGFKSWTKKDGSVNYLYQCKECMNQQAYTTHRNKLRYGELVKYSDNELKKELIRRNYIVILRDQYEPCNLDDNFNYE